MSMSGTSGSDQERPGTQAASGGPLSGFNVPWIVLLAAGLPVLVAFLVAVVGAVVAAVVANEPLDTIAFPAILGLLSGNEVGASAAGEMFDSGGSGRAGVRALPLGLVTISALVLSRVGFTRAWLQVGLRNFGWAPPVAGVLLVLGAWFVAMVVGSFTGIDVGFASASMSLRPTLTGLLLVGAGPWLLAMLMVRWTVARNLVWGLMGLQAVFASVVTSYAANDIIGDRWMTGGEQASLLITIALGSVVWSLNGVVTLLWWPFLGALGMGGSAAALGGMAGESMRFGFLEAAGETPWLWVLPPIGVAGVVLLAWFQPPPRSWTEVRLQVGRLMLALGVVFVPGLWAGRLRMNGQGDVAGEFLNELFWMGPTGSIEARITATVGAVGMPLRFVPALLAWALLAFVVAVLAAQSSGATWASNDALAGEARRAGGSLAARAKAAAEAAQQAAAQAGQQAPTNSSSPPGPAATGQPPTSGHGPTPAGPPPTAGQPPDGPPFAAGQPPAAPQPGPPQRADDTPPATESTPPEHQGPTPDGSQQGPPADWASAPPPPAGPAASPSASEPEPSAEQQPAAPPATEPTDAPRPEGNGEGEPQAPSWRDAPAPDPSKRRD